jgi:hypothetical protein
MQLHRRDAEIRVTLPDDWKWYAGMSLVVVALLAVYGSMIWLAVGRP